MAQRKEVSVTNIDGGQGGLRYSGNPDECPICHKGINPRVASGVIIGEFSHEQSKLRITFQCTRSECNETFFGYYNAKAETQGGLFYDFEKIAPKNPPKANFPDSVTQVSPDFIEIYDQAIAAESADLDEIAGIGLRKAIEFLIKDFLIHEKPNDAESIKVKYLGNCIKEDIDDANVKVCAARATWLGNDETHYVRKWLDKDIHDLKTLIRLTVNWIDNVLLTQGYLRDMDPANPPNNSDSNATT